MSTTTSETTTTTAPATKEQVDAAWRDPKLANVLYHDWEAGTYDEKWSISFDQRCIDYAVDRFVHVAGDDGWPYGRSLELGCGTGFFTLNLKLGGVLDEAHVTDLSQAMVDVSLRNAAGLGLALQGRAADAESIPYEDDSFDLVVGHAVLHHIPDLDLAMREILRVLKPGGRFVFAGEPTQRGDIVARKLSRATWSVASRLTHAPGLRNRFARPKAELDESSRAAALEAVVDIHTFDPDELARLALRAGAVDVRTVTDEFTASWFGWPVRTFEAAVKPGVLGWKWAQFAYRGWTGLNWIDGHVWEHVVPAEFFYNVSITGVKPEPA